MRLLQPLGYFAAMLLISCGSDGETKSAENSGKEADTTELYNSEVYKSATKVFYAMPSPLELATMIKSVGGDFRGDLIHDPMKANTYQSTQKRALALGVYGADLSYSAVYNRQSDALKFLAASKRLGESIGIHEAFSADIIERANANMANKDSMLAIMTEMYWESNSQLDEESREQIALLVMAGGWSEGLYLACSLNETFESEDIKDRIAEQKFAADQLDQMFAEYMDDYMIEEAYALFEPVLKSFAALGVESSNASLTKDESTGVHTIGGQTKVMLPLEDLEAIKKEALTLRQKLIEP